MLKFAWDSPDDAKNKLIAEESDSSVGSKSDNRERSSRARWPCWEGSRTVPKCSRRFANSPVNTRRKVAGNVMKILSTAKVWKLWSLGTLRVRRKLGGIRERLQALRHWAILPSCWQQYSWRLDISISRYLLSNLEWSCYAGKLHYTPRLTSLGLRLLSRFDRSRFLGIGIWRSGVNWN